MKHLKATCKTLKVASNNTSTKDDLLKPLGEHVYKKKIIMLRDEDKPVSFKNLFLVSDNQ
jgi:hypothetical protein